MKLVIRLPGERPEVVKDLSPDYKARLVKGAVIIESAVDDDGWCTLPSHLDIKPDHLRIDIAESGGGATNTGSALVVAGPDGQMLKPYRVPKGYCCADHAWFSVPACITVKASRHGHDAHVQISSHSCITKQEGWAGKIQTELVWEGAPDELPDIYGHFKAAMGAALEKSHCYHCREPHYISQPEVK